MVSNTNAPGGPAATRPIRGARGVRLGAHVSIAGGVDQAPFRGRLVGCETIQIFTKSSRQWRAKPLSPQEVSAFRANLRATGIRPVVAHDCYLVNLAAPGGELWRQSVLAFGEELARAEQLGVPYLVTHPGAHAGAGEADGIARVAEALNVLQVGGRRVQVLLEVTAGQGSSLGHRFEQLAAIIEQVEDGHRLGICLDTCHLWAAGYDIRTPAGYRDTLRQVHACLGLRRVKAIHLNDSRLGRGSRVDRHAHIGEGTLGLQAFRAFLNDPRLRRVPMILETPKDDDAVRADRKNLGRLRRLLEDGQPQRNPARREAAG